MTKLDAVIDRLRAAPPELQEQIAAQIEAALTPANLLTADQLAEIERDLNRPQTFTSHADIGRRYAHRMEK